MATVGHFLMMGLPESGKTTYLAALYNVLRASDPALSSLELRTLPVDREYFHEIERAWLRFEPMERSQHSEPKDTKLALRYGRRDIDIEIPDVSGETFDVLWEQGTWVESVRRFAAGANGLLVFVRSDTVRYPTLLEPPTADEREGRVPSRPDAELEDVGKPDLATLRTQVAEAAPTQTKLVDLLEAMRDEAPRAPIAVIVTAWDVVAGLGLSPTKWLEVNLPLLWQTLISNSDRQGWRTFGVSAQGGDVGSAQTREQLAQLEPPSSRVRMVDDDESSDLGVPLQWLLTR